MVSGSAPGPAKPSAAREVAKFQPAKAARIDKAQLAAAGERQPRMGMRRHGRIGRGHQQPPGHAEMHDPLRVCCAVFQVRRNGFARQLEWPLQFEDDVLSGAMDGKEDAALKALGLASGRRFEGFAVAAEPDLRQCGRRGRARRRRARSSPLQAARAWLIVEDYGAWVGGSRVVWRFPAAGGASLLFFLRICLIGFTRFRLADAVGLEAHNPPDALANPARRRASIGSRPKNRRLR